jgi:hypothetical protein
MPVISVSLLPGYDEGTEERLVQRLALAARSVIAAPAAGTTSFVMHANTYQRDGRVVRMGGAPHPDASALVRDFLARVEARELDAARQLLAPGFVMRFPGGAPMTRLEELLAWARERYQRVAKRIERIDESWGDGVATVHCSGMLHGVWLDGSAFEGVRFIDRFEVVGGLILRQEVWNDLAEVRPRAA